MANGKASMADVDGAWHPVSGFDVRRSARRQALRARAAGLVAAAVAILLAVAS